MLLPFPLDICWVVTSCFTFCFVINPCTFHPYAATLLSAWGHDPMRTWSLKLLLSLCDFIMSCYPNYVWARFTWKISKCAQWVLATLCMYSGTVLLRQQLIMPSALTDPGTETSDAHWQWESTHGTGLSWDSMKSLSSEKNDNIVITGKGERRAH